MPKKSIIKNTFLFDKPEYKKHFGSKDPALYCLTPYSVDINGNLFCKIGMSTNIKSRANSYHTSYPNMYNWICLLRPDLVKYSRGYADRRNFMLAIESELMDILNKDKNLIHYKSPAQAKVDTSEWYYGPIESFHSAFTEMDKKYVTDKNRSVTMLFNYSYEDAEKEDAEALKKGQVLMSVYKLIKIK